METIKLPMLYYDWEEENIQNTFKQIDRFLETVIPLVVQKPVTLNFTPSGSFSTWMCLKVLLLVKIACDPDTCRNINIELPREFQPLKTKLDTLSTVAGLMQPSSKPSPLEFTGWILGGCEFARAYPELLVSIRLAQNRYKLFNQRPVAVPAFTKGVSERNLAKEYAIRLGTQDKHVIAREILEGDFRAWCVSQLLPKIDDKEISMETQLIFDNFA